MTLSAEPTPRTFWVGLGLGAVPMAWGVHRYLEATPDLDRRLNLLAWLVGLDLAHDLLLAPVVVLIGLLVRRAVPARARAAVQVALVLTGFVLVVGLFPLLGTADGANPTIQPIAYAPAIAAVVATIWLVVAATAVLTGRSRPATDDTLDAGGQPPAEHPEFRDP